MSPEHSTQRDSVRTREALLAAAAELFAEQGYSRSTIREIAQRAGVDSALIARYFGSKAALYIATLERVEALPVDREAAPEQRARGIVQRMIEGTQLGPSPVLLAVVAPSEGADLQRAARRILTNRLARPLSGALEEAGIDRPELRAEVMVAAITGIALAQKAGTFGNVARASTKELIELANELVDSMFENHA